jgi:chemotaxis protein MotB
MSDDDKQVHKEQPIIIKKKKGHGGHGHHGGAWKVAYADFVTAMMAFFIVMWILASSAKVKESVSSHFSKPGPFKFETTKGSPIQIIAGAPPKGSEGGKDSKSGKGQGTFMEFNPEMRDSVVSKLQEKARIDSAKAAELVKKAGESMEKELKEMIAKKPELTEILSSIKIIMTNEGLRIELLETKDALFFEVGSSKVTEKAKLVLNSLAKEIGKLPNFVEIEGHTDIRKYGKNAGYSNWELSADRANTSRKILETGGLFEGQIEKVTGYADKKLLTPENPFDMSNRRVSILIKNLKSTEFLQNDTKSIEGENKNEHH